MTFSKRTVSRWALMCAATLILSSCGLPRTGPNKGEIFAGSVERQGNAFVVLADDNVTAVTAFDPSLTFNESFLNAGVLGSDTVRPGDTLGLMIWENVDDGLLATDGTSSSRLEEIQVDGDGFIFVPYAGRLRAAGNSPEGIRRIITERLEPQTPDPQVVVQRMAGDGATVSLVGAVGAQGVYPIERPTRTLTAMLAQAGGITLPPESTQVTLIRGSHSGTIFLTDLYSNPRLDVALRAGDRILVEEDERFYTALGAAGQQTRVPFENQTLSAVEALATVGGINPNLADPTGIFVFRDEPAEVANKVLGRSDLVGPQRMIYLFDLTAPNGVFVARDFQIRSEDTVFVTEAPYTQFSRILQALITPLGTASSLQQLEL